jgi:uncharacterized protein involved in type VI secretion and phage assembly
MPDAREVMLKLSLPPAAYELTLSEDVAPWTVTRVFIVEGLNRPYRVVIDVEAEGEPDADSLLGCDAALHLLRGGEQRRAVCGVVSRVDHTGSVDRHTTVRFEIIPAFELLRQRAKSQIWQEVSVQKIVDAPGSELLLAPASHGKYDVSRQLDTGATPTGGVPPGQLSPAALAGISPILLNAQQLLDAA